MSDEAVWVSAPENCHMSELAKPTTSSAPVVNKRRTCVFEVAALNVLLDVPPAEGCRRPSASY